MKRYREKTVFNKTEEALFYVIKVGNRYLGEDNVLVDDIQDAEAFDDYEDADWNLDDFIDNVDLESALSDNAYNLQYFRDEERKYWGDDYDREDKDDSGLIDDYDARAEVRKDCSVVGVFASGFKL